MRHRKADSRKNVLHRVHVRMFSLVLLRGGHGLLLYLAAHSVVKSRDLDRPHQQAITPSAKDERDTPTAATVLNLNSKEIVIDEVASFMNLLRPHCGSAAYRVALSSWICTTHEHLAIRVEQNRLNTTECKFPSSTYFHIIAVSH